MQKEQWLPLPSRYRTTLPLMKLKPGCNDRAIQESTNNAKIQSKLYKTALDSQQKTKAASLKRWKQRSSMAAAKPHGIRWMPTVKPARLNTSRQISFAPAAISTLESQPQVSFLLTHHSVHVMRAVASVAQWESTTTSLCPMNH